MLKSSCQFYSRDKIKIKYTFSGVFFKLISFFKNVDLITIENFTEIVMEESEKLSSSSISTVIVESDEDKTIKSLDNKRKMLFKKDSKTPQER